MPSQKRDEPVPVQHGTTGPARRPPATESTAARPDQEELDRRQARVRETRRRGPELGPARESGVRTEPPDVPPTECDDEGEQ